MAKPTPNTHSHTGAEPSDFVRSIMALSPDDIVKAKKKKRSGLDFILDNLRYVILFVCLVILVGSGFYIADTLKQYSEGEDLYDGLGNMIMGDAGMLEIMYQSPQSPNSPDHEASQDLTDEEIENMGSVETPSVNKEFERIKSQLVTLKKKYPDLYGWIILPGTVINYPVMQAKDNDYYLNRSYKGTKLKAGAIFADYRNSRELLKNDNLVLYGHHMSNNTMFNSLDKYLDRSFFEGNNTVYIYTLDGMFTYKVFSVYETNKYYRYIQSAFNTREDFLIFAEEIAANSIYKAKDLPLDTESKILTLSTCTNRSENGRLAVHAVMVDSYLVGEQTVTKG